MIDIYNSFVTSIGVFLYPLEDMINWLSFPTLAVLCVAVAFVSLYSSLVDKCIWKYYRVTIIRRIARFIIIILFIAGTYNLLVMFLLFYYILLTFLEIKETADRRFSRRIE